MRIILDEVDYDITLVQSEPSSAVNRSSPVSGEDYAQISQLRSKLLPLIAIENSLTSELNGGVSISGGRTGIFVRAGWQAPKSPASLSTVASLAAKTLASVHNAVKELWQHPAVQALMRLRRLQLDDSASLCVSFCCVIPHLADCTTRSFLDDIQRVAEPDYIPSTSMLLNCQPSVAHDIPLR